MRPGRERTAGGIWCPRVREAIIDITNGRLDRRFTNQELLDSSLGRIVAETESTATKPDRSLSEALQKLRNVGEVEFIVGHRGHYRYLPNRSLGPIDVESHELEVIELDEAIYSKRLRLGVVPADAVVGQARRRIGQERLRELTRQLYEGKCAVCEIDIPELLITSHIVPWAEDEEARGHLDNIICLCRFHDALFERGYWGLSNKLRIIRSSCKVTATISMLLGSLNSFRAPREWQPSVKYVTRHRELHGLNAD